MKLRGIISSRMGALILGLSLALVGCDDGGDDGGGNTVADTGGGGSDTGGGGDDMGGGGDDMGGGGDDMGGGGDDIGGGGDDTGGGGTDTGGGNDDTGGGTDTGGGGEDTGGTTDMGGEEDAGAVEDTGGGEECVPETCPTPPTTEPDVALVSKTGLATGFAGGDVPMGNWALESAELYPDSLNNGDPFPIPLEASSNGNTFGSVQFTDGAWGLLANIDVKLAIPSLGQNFEFTQEVSGGGCCTFDGATIIGDLLACYEGDPPEISLPESFMYSNAEGTLRILVEINKDVILAAIPAEFAGLAGMFIKDDLQIVLEFSAIIQ